MIGMLRIKLHNPHHKTNCALHIKEHRKGMAIAGVSTEIATPSQGQIEKIKKLCTGEKDCLCLYQIAQQAEVNGVRYPMGFNELTITIYI